MADDNAPQAITGQLAIQKIYVKDVSFEAPNSPAVFTSETNPTADVHFANRTQLLDAVWGYTPSVENMKRIMGWFAFDQALLNDDLARMRYEASARPGVQEAWDAMFPAPRQRWVDAMASPEAAIRALPHPGLLLTLAGFFGLLFLTTKLRDSGWGVLSVFGLTGFMGYTLGPILGQHLALPNGHQVVMMAMGGTAAIFLALSAYALVTRKDFSFMGGFLLAGIVVAFLAGLGALFFDVPALSLTVSAAFVLLMGGLILFETSRIVHGGETNYVMATVSLYVSIYNLFVSLLALFGFGSSSD